MILHLLTDEKFSNYAIKQFEGDSMSSKFVVISQTEGLKHIDRNTQDKIILINPDSDSFYSLIENLDEYKAIILHGLFWPWQEKVLCSVPDNVKVGWVFWGGDIYGRQDLKDTFFSPSSIILNKVHKAISFLKGRKEVNGYEIPKELLSRIDYCLTDVAEDYEYASNYIEKKFAELWYNYYSIEETIGDLKDSICSGENILIGNSATLECNHIKGLFAIKKSKPKESKIIAPLSYGYPWVRQYISKIGNILFSDKFIPLKEFMPLEEYNKTILSCSAVVMPHYRPQAFGNIITALWLGCRVYMSEKNNLFTFFKRIGCVVFSIESERINCTPVTDTERNLNRAILSAYYSYDRMKQKNIELVKELES